MMGSAPRRREVPLPGEPCRSRPVVATREKPPEPRGPRLGPQPRTSRSPIPAGGRQVLIQSISGMSNQRSSKGGDTAQERRHPSHASRVPPWVWWIPGLLGAGLLAAVLVQKMGGPAAEEDRGPENPGAGEEQDAPSPVEALLQTPGNLKEQLGGLIRQFEKGEDLAGILRGGDASARRLELWRTRFPAPAPVHFERPLKLHALSFDHYAFLVLSGTRRDHSKFGMYFVKEDGAIRLDWEAGEGLSEILPAEVPGLTDYRPRMMRVFVEKSDLYSLLYPEARYQSYILQHFDATAFVWAFAERGSRVHRRLEQRIRLEDPWGEGKRVTVMARRGREGSRPNEMELVELLGKEWLMPPP